MWALKVAWYRTFQAVFNIGARVLPWRKAQRVEGPGSIARIPELLRGENVQKTLVVTDPGLMKAGVAPRILEVLDAAKVPYALFSEVEPNPSVTTVEKIVSLYHAEGCGGFVAIGGGSSMDAAKAAAARVVKPKKSVNQLGGLLRVLRRIPPFVAVPTTAGTGSETTIAALITDTATHHKYAIMDLFLIPKYAVLDAELTLGLPPHITSTTGMDALTHAVEAFLCWTYNTKESIRFAEEATAAIFQNLEKLYNDGSDVEARQEMLVASYKAGFAFTRAGVGNVHGIAHTLGGLYNTPHGLANAVILPIVLEDYGEKVHKKLAHLAKLAGVAQGNTEAEQAESFIAAIRAMNGRMNIPKGFDFIRDEDIPQMVAWAGKECNPLYPVPVVYDPQRYTAVIEKVRIYPASGQIPKTAGAGKAYTITEACTGCTACAKACPVFAISGEARQQHTINAARCVACGVCGRVCPAAAVQNAAGETCQRVPRTEWEKPSIIKELCSACAICVNICTAGALRIALPAFKGDIRVAAELAEPKKCVACGLCERECPLSAVTMQPAKLQPAMGGGTT